MQLGGWSAVVGCWSDEPCCVCGGCVKGACDVGLLLIGIVHKAVHRVCHADAVGPSEMDAVPEQPVCEFRYALHFASAFWQTCVRCVTPLMGPLQGGACSGPCEDAHDDHVPVQTLSRVVGCCGAVPQSMRTQGCFF